MGRPPKTRVQLLKLLQENPLLSYKEIAHRLGIKASSAAVAKSKLRRLLRGNSPRRFCPNCSKQSVFVESGEGSVCSNCGAVYANPNRHSSNPFGRGPVDALHWGNNLGSAPNYAELNRHGVVKNHSKIIENILVDAVEADAFTRSALEELMNILEPLNLSYRDTHDIGLDLRRRIRAWRESNPLLTPNNTLKEQLIMQTLLAASLDKPRLTGVARSYMHLITLKHKKMDAFTESCLREFLQKAPPKAQIAELVRAAKTLVEKAPQKRRDLKHLSEEELRQIIIQDALKALQSHHRGRLCIS